MIAHATAPVAMRLELTRKCNLDCFHCLANATRAGAARELSTPQWLAFFRRLEELHVFALTVTGGEIFVRPDVFTLLEHLASARHHRVQIQTNGTLISRDVARHLHELRLKHVTVSLDGLQQVHDRVRGAGAFDRTLRGVQHLIEFGIVPSIAFTAMRINLQELGPLIDLLASTGVTAVRVNQLAAEGRCRPIYKELALRFPEDIRELMAIIDLKHRDQPAVTVKCGIGIHLNLPRRHARGAQPALPADEDGRVTYLNSGCGACVTSCQVSATGDVLPCEGLLEFVGGNILESDFLDIWRHAKPLQRIRDLRKIPVFELECCATCAFNRICNAGCRAQAYNVYGDLLGPDPACPYCAQPAGGVGCPGNSTGHKERPCAHL